MGDGTTQGGIKIGGSPTTTDWTIYVATSTYGGTSGGSGLTLKSGTATGSTAFKLIDSGGGFSSLHLNKTVYNATDDKWAKITNIDSATQVTLSVDIMNTGRPYAISDAVDSLQGGWDKIENPFWANPTVRLSDGTFSGDATLDGKLPAGNFNITVQASSNTAVTTLSGDLTIRQKVNIQGITGSNFALTGNIYTRGTADVTWDRINATGKLLTFDNAINTIANSTFTIGNDPTNITSTNSTINTGYTLYVATSALGGSDTINDGLEITSGSATSTTANKLVDSTAAFTSAVNGKTVYNSTDDTWAKVTGVDSGTTLSLSADIMASGESYVIAAARSTIQGGVDKVPGAVNCDTTVRATDGTFSEQVTVQGKDVSGNYTIKVLGTKTLDSSWTATGGVKGTLGTQGTVTVASGLGVNTRQNKWIRFTSGGNNGVVRLIDSHTDTTITIVGTWNAAPLSGETFVIEEPGTIITAAPASAADGVFRVVNGQKAMRLEDLQIKRTNSGWNLHLLDYSVASIFNCYFTGFGRSMVQNSCAGNFNQTMHDEFDVSRTFRMIGSSVFKYRCKMEGGGANHTMVYVDDLSRYQLALGSVIDGKSFAGITGISIERLSIGVFTGVGSIYQQIRNCNIGINATTGGQGNGTLGVTYTSNTTDESADATSYGYID